MGNVLSGSSNNRCEHMGGFPDNASDEEQVAVDGADCHQARVTPLSTLFQKNPHHLQHHSNASDSPVKVRTKARPRSKSDGWAERYKLK